MLIAKVLIGFVTGTMVGMTGLGGGVLLLPMLIFGLGVPPIIAVGSDMVCNATCKIGAGYMHWRRNNVNWNVVAGLSMGSVPGVIIGAAVLGHLRALYDVEINRILRDIIGVLLLVVPCLMLLQGKLRSGLEENRAPARAFCPGLVLIGALAGFLVGMTSVGSGSLVMTLLLLAYPFAPRAMVGTDILNAVLMTGVGSLLHLRMGTVDLNLVASLLIGAIPGGLLGTQLANRIPAHWLRRVLCGALFVTGARMLA